MKKYNLIVAGGGLTGVAAAVSAAREGLSVLIIEKNGSFGGAMTNNLVYPFMRYHTVMINGEKKILSDGIFTEMRKLHMKKYMENKNYADYLRFNPECFKFTLDEMIEEAGTDVLFHSLICGATVKDKRITEITVANSLGTVKLEADYFIDCTGDGSLFYIAGCDYQLGRSSDRLCQPMTTCFRMSGVDIEQFLKDRERLQALYKERQKAGIIKNPREDILCFLGVGKDVLHFNSTRIIKLDPTNPFEISRAEIMARKQIVELEKFLKENSTAFRSSSIINIAAEIGIRESRKLKGVHILNEDELKKCVKFEDGIALGNYDIDIHNPEGSGTSHYYFKDGEYYSIPYRSLLPKEITNLLVAGRNISATHEAQASIRIMPICACLGQAAGTAIAIAHKTGKDTHTLSIPLLKETLKANGAAID